MNPFKVGDRVRFVTNFKYDRSPKNGDEFVITSTFKDLIGFKSSFYLNGDRSIEKEVRCGRTPAYKYEEFVLVMHAEDIEFNEQMEEVLDESV